MCTCLNFFTIKIDVEMKVLNEQKYSRNLGAERKVSATR